MIVPEGFVQGRGGFTTRGKDNGSPYYCYRFGRGLDGGRPLLDLDHQAVYYGVLAIQRRLTAEGYPILDNGRFGPGTHTAVRAYQRDNGLKIDGVVGPATCKKLWHPLVAFIGTDHARGRPDLLWGQTMHESAGGDPGAVSGLYKIENGPDLGLSQINRRFNPQVTVPQAFDPVFAFEFSARRIGLGLDKYDGKGPELQEACAIAQHNNPRDAALWYEIGYWAEDDPLSLYVERIRTLAAQFR